MKVVRGPVVACPRKVGIGSLPTQNLGQHLTLSANDMAKSKLLRLIVDLSEDIY